MKKSIQVRKISVNVFVGYIIIVVVGSSISLLSVFLAGRIGSVAQSSPKPVPIVNNLPPSQYPDFDAIKGKNPDTSIKSIHLTDNCPADICKSDKPASGPIGGIKKSYVVKGELSRGYLYIEAAVDYTRPLTRYDDFYFTINYHGGLLSMTENLLPTPPGDISILLYDLRSISYTYGSSSFKNVDFLNLLRNRMVINIQAAVSSSRPGRVMKEVSIFYQCNSGADCSIEELK